MTDPIVEAVNVVKLLGKGAAQIQALKGVSLALKGGELTLTFRQRQDHAVVDPRIWSPITSTVSSPT